VIAIRVEPQIPGTKAPWFYEVSRGDAPPELHCGVCGEANAIDIRRSRFSGLWWVHCAKCGQHGTHPAPPLTDPGAVPASVNGGAAMDTQEPQQDPLPTDPAPSAEVVEQTQTVAQGDGDDGATRDEYAPPELHCARCGEAV
jgi:hypothetical protein